MREKFCEIVPDTSGVPYRQFPRCYRSGTMIVELCSLTAKSKLTLYVALLKILIIHRECFKIPDFNISLSFSYVFSLFFCF